MSAARVTPTDLVIASVSGGKDSAALSLWLKEQGIEHKRVFADTGWEHEATYDYVRGELTRVLGPIDEVGHPGGMKALIAKKGMFPSRLRRFCTEDLKVRPIGAYIRHHQDAGREIINAVGIRAAESKTRAAMEEHEWSDALDCLVWRPLIKWTEEEVIAIHHRHGLRPNPLYLKGASRVGCWPCIFARKSEIKLIAEIDPARIDAIRDLEREAQAKSKARRAEAGIEETGNPPTFFYGHSVSLGQKTTAGAPRPHTPIDTVLEWSKTAQGGKQFLLLDGDQPEGCVRWGLCEAPSKEKK